MFKREVIGFQQTNTTSQHVFYSLDDANKLVVFFPGGSSDTSGPYFYYLSDYFLRNSYDVLCLSYKGLITKGDSYADQVQKITQGAHAASLYVRKTKKYQKTVYVSRSIGNVFSNETRMRFHLDVDKCIYISPVAKALPTIKKFPGFIVTSDKDEYLDENHLKEIRSYPNHETLVIEDCDHSLECDDTIKNIDMCKKTITKLIAFVSK